MPDSKGETMIPNEIFVDHRTHSYYGVRCGAQDKYILASTAERDRKEALTLLRELVDLQDGSPLCKYEDEWNDTMKRSYELLTRTGE